MGLSILTTASSTSVTFMSTEQTLTSPLVCLTDFRPCCRGEFSRDQPIVGEWHYPNGSIVPGKTGFGGFFRTRGVNNGTVNLFRRNSGISSPSGHYCCEIPVYTITENQTLCINLGKQSAYFLKPGGMKLVSSFFRSLYYDQ